MEQRDAADGNRQHAPLVQAADALAIDTTSMTIDRALKQMLAVVNECRRSNGQAGCEKIAP
ncbi:MAG: (d)CMP kinase [Syntrophotaleaceae bacterium]